VSRPYFEMKVVKVEGKKKEYCPRCGSEIIMEKAVGNWVNGECIDKIKFPCFCSFRYFGEKMLGQINHSKNGELPYELVNITKQKDTNVYRHSGSLKELIENHDIHILRGKIILFEEEK